MDNTKLTNEDNQLKIITRLIVLGFPFILFVYAIWNLINNEKGMGILLIISIWAYILIFQFLGYRHVIQKIKYHTALITLSVITIPLSIIAWFTYIIVDGIKLEAFIPILILIFLTALPFTMAAGYRLQPYNWEYIKERWKTLLIPALVILSFIFPVLWLIGLLLVVIWVFNNAWNESVTKHRPDLLATDETALKVITLLNNGYAGIWCGEIQGKSLYASIQDRAVVIGPPGTGKTVFLIAQLLEWAKTKRSFVCLDVKPEIQDKTKTNLEAQGYRVITFNPSSTSGHCYNPLADLDSPESIGEFASSLIPSNEEDNAVFNESARDFLDAIISHLKKNDTPTLPKIWELISECESYKELLQILSNSEDADARSLANSLSSVSSNERLMGSIFATFKANIRFLRYPNIRKTLESSDFSLAELTSDKPIALFLQFEEKHAQITGQLFSAIIGHLLRYLIMHTNREPVLLLLDEIGTVPPVTGLVQKLNTIRSRNLPTWMYWQSIEQMQRYGTKADEGPNTILAACDFQMVFRLNDNATAEWMSKRLGTVDRLVKNVTVTIGDGFFPNRTYAQQLVTEPVAFPHQIQQLENSDVICTYRGAAWRGYAKPYFK